MKMSKGTWHYQLASYYGGGWFHTRTDLCSYVKAMMWGCVRLVWWGIVFTVASLLPVHGLIFLGFWIYDSSIEAGPGAILAGIVAAVIVGGAVLLGLLGGVVWLYENRPRRKADAPPSFVREVYTGWKEKYCPVIEFAEPPSQNSSIQEK